MRSGGRLLVSRLWYWLSASFPFHRVAWTLLGIHTLKHVLFDVCCHEEILITRMRIFQLLTGSHWLLINTTSWRSAHHCCSDNSVCSDELRWTPWVVLCYRKTRMLLQRQWGQIGNCHPAFLLKSQRPAAISQRLCYSACFGIELFKLTKRAKRTKMKPFLWWWRLGRAGGANCQQRRDEKRWGETETERRRTGS